MRTSLPTLLLLACVVVPVQGQTCKKAPPPFLPTLLPESVAGMPLEFSSDPTGACMSLFRPEDLAARATSPWAVVILAINPDDALGESGEVMHARFTALGERVVKMGDWPVVMRELVKGDEYVALRGSVKLTVLVKNGDHGAVSDALAARFFEAILPKIPCG
ncbi:MAG TPA: hypothetical protein VJ997_06215 [Longimicrobiales bacterium]|nr:hypothetical protein [Longimicrobiales bacterium]